MNIAQISIGFRRCIEQKFGIDIYALSGWNEPDKLASLGGWATCAWSEEEMAKFVLEKLVQRWRKEATVI